MIKKLKHFIRYLYGSFLYSYYKYKKQEDKEEVQPEVKNYDMKLLPFIGDDIRLRMGDEIFNCLHYYKQAHYDVDDCRYIDGTISRILLYADLEVVFSSDDLERFYKISNNMQTIELLDFPYFMIMQGCATNIEINYDKNFTVKFHIIDGDFKTITLR